MPFLALSQCLVNPFTLGNVHKSRNPLQPAPVVTPDRRGVGRDNASLGIFDKYLRIVISVIRLMPVDSRAGRGAEEDAERD